MHVVCRQRRAHWNFRRPQRNSLVYRCQLCAKKSAPPRLLAPGSHSLAVRPCADDSTHLLTGGADNACKLWKVETGECLHTWKHTAPVRDVRFALGDQRFLTVLDNIMGNVPTIFVWPLELDNLKDHPDCPVTTINKGHTAKITRALWGPINRSIFSGSDDATLRVWDPESGEQKHIVEGVHTKRITDMQFSWDMTLLVTSWYAPHQASLSLYTSPASHHASAHAQPLSHHACQVFTQAQPLNTPASRASSLRRNRAFPSRASRL